MSRCRSRASRILSSAALDSSRFHCLSVEARAGREPPGVPVPAPRSGDHEVEPWMSHGHHVHRVRGTALAQSEVRGGVPEGVLDSRGGKRPGSGLAGGSSTRSGPIRRSTTGRRRRSSSGGVREDGRPRNAVERNVPGDKPAACRQERRKPFGFPTLSTARRQRTPALDRAMRGGYGVTRRSRLDRPCRCPNDGVHPRSRRGWILRSHRRGRLAGYAETSTSSTWLVGSGTGSPSSRSPAT